MKGGRVMNGLVVDASMRRLRGSWGWGYVAL